MDPRRPNLEIVVVRDMSCGAAECSPKVGTTLQCETTIAWCRKKTSRAKPNSTLVSSRKPTNAGVPNVPDQPDACDCQSHVTLVSPERPKVDQVVPSSPTSGHTSDPTSPLHVPTTHTTPTATHVLPAWCRRSVPRDRPTTCACR